MRYLVFGAAVLLLAAGPCLGQQSTIDSPSLSPNQNQILTGEKGHSSPPSPSFDGGVPDASDRVSGTPANVNTMQPSTAPPAAAEPTSPGMAVFLPAQGQNASAPANRTGKSGKQQRQAP